MKIIEIKDCNICPFFSNGKGCNHPNKAEEILLRERFEKCPLKTTPIKYIKIKLTKQEIQEIYKQENQNHIFSISQKGDKNE